MFLDHPLFSLSFFAWHKTRNNISKRNLQQHVSIDENTAEAFLNIYISLSIYHTCKWDLFREWYCWRKKLTYIFIQFFYISFMTFDRNICFFFICIYLSENKCEFIYIKKSEIICRRVYEYNYIIFEYSLVRYCDRRNEESHIIIERLKFIKYNRRYLPSVLCSMLGNDESVIWYAPGSALGSGLCREFWIFSTTNKTIIFIFILFSNAI